jgi:hypothetical protein
LPAQPPLSDRTSPSLDLGTTHLVWATDPFAARHRSFAFPSSQFLTSRPVIEAPGSKRLRDWSGCFGGAVQCSAAHRQSPPTSRTPTYPPYLGYSSQVATSPNQTPWATTLHPRPRVARPARPASLHQILTAPRRQFQARPRARPPCPATAMTRLAITAASPATSSPPMPPTAALCPPRRRSPKPKALPS